MSGPAFARLVEEELLARAVVRAATGAYAPGHEFHGNQWETTGGEYSTRKVFKHTPEEPPWSKIADIDAGHKKPHVHEIALHKLTPTQFKLSPGKVAEFKKHGHSELPVVIRKGGKILIHDGHHRLAGAIARGDKTAVVHVYSREHDASFDVVQAATLTLPDNSSANGNVKAAIPEPPGASLSHHTAAQDAAAAIYRRAVDSSVAVMEAGAVKAAKQAETERKRKNREREELEAAALLLFLAGVAAYQTIYPSLEAAALAGAPEPAPKTTTPAPVGEPVQIAGPTGAPDLAVEADDFATGRVGLLEGFPARAQDLLWKAKAQAEADGLAPNQVARRITAMAKIIEDGQGRVVAITEATTCYGNAQERVLTRAGYLTKNWTVVGDESTCAECLLNEQQGDIPVGDRFISGDASPPAHPSCRCWLTPGSKRPERVAEVKSSDPHDVSGEARDTSGKWTAGSAADRKPATDTAKESAA